MAQQNIVTLIRDLDRGRIIPEMNEAMSQIVEAIEEARGAGTGEITLKLKVKSKSEGVYTIIPTLTVKKPERPRTEMLTFYDEQSGELIRRDPRQPDLPSVVLADELNNRRRGATD